MPRRDDIVTIVIDTKNEMKRSIDGLGIRLNDLERDLRTAVAGEVTALRENALTDLKSSQQETRTSAYNAGKRAGEAVTAVAELRRDIDRLHTGLDSLREDVGQILEVLHSATPVSAAGAPDGPYPVRAGAGDTVGPEGVPLPGQRPAPAEESRPAVADRVAAVEAPSAVESAIPSTPTESPVSGGDEGGQPVPEAQEQAAPAVEGREEGERDVPRAALEASEGNSGGPAKEPSPLTWDGRIWAVMRAGRVASATLVCHRDTWEFVAAQVGSHPHFRTPALEERENGLVAAVLSGRSLVAMLLALYRVAQAAVRRPDGEDAEELVAYADWAMAYQVYYATARVLGRASSVEGDPVVVTIDSRVPARQ
ncbi:hypothetical protein [Streptomyces sp. NPDC001948]